MYVQLPAKGFSYYAKDRERDYAYVSGDTLYIKGLPSWEGIAYDLSYANSGKKRCKYCGKKTRRRKMTVDHMFPRNYGGVSIPINLLPTCKECNSSKSDLNYYQYKIFRNMSKEDGNRFRRKVFRENEKLRYERGFILPRKWITTMPISEIIAREIPENGQTKKKYKKVSMFLKRYQKLPNPLVISANNFLLEGNTVYWVALEHNIQEVPVIKLENVFVEL